MTVDYGESPKLLGLPMVTACSNHTNESLKGQIGQGEHLKRRRMIMHGTILAILRTISCASGGIYRPANS